MMDESTSTFELPGFRFHPTEEELLGFYLKNVVSGTRFNYDIIGFLNVYHHDPWDLPGLAKIGEREWYFFVPRDRRHSNGGRPNRTTKHGFWKATGSDRKIFNPSQPRAEIGLKKTLVFYKGKAPRGCKTDWVMNEYRLPQSEQDIVLCKIYRKATSLKVLEQRAAEMEEATTKISHSPPPQQQNDLMALKKEDNEEEEVLLSEQEVLHRDDVTAHNIANFSSEQQQWQTTGNGIFMEDDLQVAKFSTDWIHQDPAFWALLCSP